MNFPRHLVFDEVVSLASTGVSITMETLVACPPMLMLFIVWTRMSMFGVGAKGVLKACWFCPDLEGLDTLDLFSRT
jgi:hypothetical protein